VEFEKAPSREVGVFCLKQVSNDRNKAGLVKSCPFEQLDGIARIIGNTRSVSGNTGGCMFIVDFTTGILPLMVDFFSPRIGKYESDGLLQAVTLGSHNRARAAIEQGLRQKLVHFGADAF